MDTVTQIVGGLTTLGAFVCFILLLIKMFQRGQTVMGIVCIVLFPCCFIGWLIGFIFGWVKAREWGITNIMIIWTVCFGLNILMGIINPAPYQQIQEQIRQMQQQGK